MIKIIPPEQFRQIPWKNGRGSTTKLLINEGGTLDAFQWRISMAVVVEDGIFSDFSGYTRNLVLIEGDGIDLQHDQCKTDQLTRLLDVATFDGGCKTAATLKSGQITDFNVISSTDKYQAVVDTYRESQTVKLKACSICLLYGLNRDISLQSQDGSVAAILPVGHLLYMTGPGMDNLSISGQEMIVVCLDELVVDA